MLLQFRKSCCGILAILRRSLRRAFRNSRNELLFKALREYRGSATCKPPGHATPDAEQ